MYNNEAVLPNWIDEFMKVAKILGTSNVFISIFENDSKDSTSILLDEFRELLDLKNIKHKIVTSKGEFSRGNSERITYLSMIRNQALKPLFSMLSSFQSPSNVDAIENENEYINGNEQFMRSFVGNKHSKLLFLNDIYFKAVDIVRLISTANMEHDFACGLDFYTLFYDHYATRDYFPYVRHVPSQKLARRGGDFSVYSCWNGGVSMNPGPFVETHLQFRANGPDVACIHSECSLICEDFRQLGYTRIFLNPNVKVTYQSSDYLFHQYLTPISDFFLALFHYPKPTYVALGADQQLANITILCGTPPKK